MARRGGVMQGGNFMARLPPELQDAARQKMQFQALPAQIGPAKPAWQQLREQGIAGQGSAAANRAKLASMQPSAPMQPAGRPRMVAGGPAPIRPGMGGGGVMGNPGPGGMGAIIGYGPGADPRMGPGPGGQKQPPMAPPGMEKPMPGAGFGPQAPGGPVAMEKPMPGAGFGGGQPDPVRMQQMQMLRQRMEQQGGGPQYEY